MTTDYQSVEIALGHLVNGHQLQVGIALAVAQGVWHWPGLNESPVWQVGEIIDVLKKHKNFVLRDPDKILSLSGAPFGVTSRIWVDRADYIQAALLLGSQSIDVMRQLRS